MCTLRCEMLPNVEIVLACAAESFVVCRAAERFIVCLLITVRPSVGPGHMFQ